MRIDTLKASIPVLRRMGVEIGIEITEEEMARKMSMSQAQFDGYLNAEGKTPNAVLTQLWAAYDDLIKAVQRSNYSSSIRGIINLVKDRGKARGMHITDEEIVEKIAIPRERFEAYVNGEIYTPEEVLSLFWSAWPDLLKNDFRITSVQTVSVTVDDQDEDVE